MISTISKLNLKDLRFSIGISTGVKTEVEKIIVIVV